MGSPAIPIAPGHLSLVSIAIDLLLNSVPIFHVFKPRAVIPISVVMIHGSFPLSFSIAPVSGILISIIVVKCTLSMLQALKYLSFVVPCPVDKL